MDRTESQPSLERGSSVCAVVAIYFTATSLYALEASFVLAAAFASIAALFASLAISPSPDTAAA